ncbi:MAG: glutamine transporter substrate-binding protein [Firmicutes bacterium]|nr:glutamine transporter substrate-binding protein [Bacillota bacterium]
MKKRSVLLPIMLMTVTSLVAACGGATPSTPGSTTPAGPTPTAANSLDRVKNAKTLLVAVDTTYPPMESIDEKDGTTPVGFDVDLAKAVAQKLGVQAKFVVSDWNGIIPGLISKRFDVIMSSMNITPERQQQVDFVEYAKMSQVFVSRVGSPEVKTENDLAGKVVVVQAGTTSEDWVNKVKADKVKDIKEIRSFPGATDAFLELKNKRGDVVVIDQPVGIYYSLKDAATFKITGEALSPEAIGVAVRKEDPELKAAIDKAVADLKADGTYAKIQKTWFGDYQLGK